MAVNPGLLNALRWRNIGPHRGGRVGAVAGHPTDPNVYYFGACAGGVWMTRDGGTYWENISDGFFNTASVGAIAISESDPNVIYVGSGEGCIRIDVTHGDGVYKSTDGGKTWRNVGLKDSRHIGRVRIHPKDPNTVYVAASGHAFGPNNERGVYRSTDGGETWDRVLYKSDDAGAIDISMDPNNPRLIYAAIWQRQRTFWEMSSGGPDSGLYKSTDGGDTWEDITSNPGMPNGLIGRIGVAVSPAKPGRVWALIENKDDGGLFRSDDGGATWEHLTDDDGIRSRPWYYTHVFADPQDPETVWTLSLNCWKSTDGGRTFTDVGTPHGDNHDLWIDPRNPLRMIEGNDGGATVTYNGGVSWSTIYNQPTACFYHVTTDNQNPYRVYGTQQDNSAISTPSRTWKGAIPWGDNYTVGSSESGHIAVKPDDSNVVYSGSIGSSPGGGGNMLRYDHSTGQVRLVTIWPEMSGGQAPSEYKYRFQWTYPIVFSPHDPNTLYATGNVAFKTTDDGTTWEAISPDLTRNDPEKQILSGGPISSEGGGAEVYCTIYAFVESPHEKDLLWAGTDDGLVHISRDGGGNWEEVTPPDVEAWSRIAMIEVSPHDPATAYVAATRYKLDDNRPLLFKTNDYGKTWQKIVNGIPEDDFTWVVREDPERRGLLYAGTETNIYVSLDDGESWQSMRSNLPVVPIYDLVVKGNDLVVGTHGRSFWILDDITPLRQLTDEVAGSDAHLFKPRTTHRFPPAMGLGLDRRTGVGKSYQLALGVPATFYFELDAEGRSVRKFVDAGDNPPTGVVVCYYLKEKPESDVTLTFLDSGGEVIKSFSSGSEDGPEVPAEDGANSFVWNMRYPDARKVKGEAMPQTGRAAVSLLGPVAAPGEYQVRLEAGGQVLTQDFEIAKDPGAQGSNEDLRAQFDLLMAIRDKISETHDSVSRLRSIREQVAGWKSRAEGRSGAEPVLEAAQQIEDKLTAVEDELFNSGGETRATATKLNGKLASLTAVVASADWVPTQQSHGVFEDVSARADAQATVLQSAIDEDVPAFVALIHELEIPTIV